MFEHVGGWESWGLSQVHSILVFAQLKKGFKLEVT